MGGGGAGGGGAGGGGGGGAMVPDQETFDKVFSECLLLFLIVFKDKAHPVCKRGPSYTTQRLLIFLLKKYITLEEFDIIDQESDEVVAHINQLRSEGIDPYNQDV